MRRGDEPAPKWMRVVAAVLVVLAIAATAFMVWAVTRLPPDVLRF